MKVNELAFEDAIEASLLLSGGYTKSPASHFDFDLGLDTEELFGFIAETQTSWWDELVKRYGNNSNAAQKGFVARLSKELDNRGTLDVLRHGVVDLGVEIRLAYFKPAHGLTPELVARYDANRLTVSRQLPFDPGSTKTIDLALFVNGIPVATAELKNTQTGQSIDDAIKQYRQDRDPKNVTLGRRAIVHFAVDPHLVSMTTRLAGQSTQFLPFSLGHNYGKGNPPNPNGHETNYLWERVWEKDAWLDLLGRFVHVERPTTGSLTARRVAETVIFPRYHQWDCVLRLVDHAREHGAGHHYLIEHSAGSGKSNTIAWTAHRLSTLHDNQDHKIFDKVVVITDRLVLDKQLQDTIYQFEHAHGVVEKIDKDSRQLEDALTGEQARIIITTLQKFTVVADRAAELPNRRYAVIVDEAHSSQTSESAKDLRVVLGATDETELTVAEAEDAGLVTQPVDPVEERLAQVAGARGRQENLSFFAFTATPKARTLELFGTYSPESKRYEPFHLYTMRQAIEEGFIMDVLASYTTYETFWKIEKRISDDPNYQPTKAARAIARFVELHPYQLGQKAEVIVEHFKKHVAGRIGGHAKAMVVTSSRLHALRYHRAITQYIDEKRYADLKVLVAFSGKILDGPAEFTESRMNGFPESETAERFDSDDYQVLIVAEKFQTGFDQPLLHTMYVDKVLTGLAAVQTLSRLNRIHPRKEETFVLDFRNDVDDVRAAFEPYYGKTVAPPTDPNLLYDTRSRLGAFGVIREDEVDRVIELLLSEPTPDSHAKVYTALRPAVDRANGLTDEDRYSFKDALDKFVRTYSFLSQIVTFTDTALERYYQYCRALALELRDRADQGRIDISSEVELTHLRNELTFQGSLSLEADTGEVQTIYGEGRGPSKQPEMVPLSHIIEILNERFGLKLTDSDQLLFDQFEADWLADPVLGDQARSNSLDNFRLVFEPKFLDTIIQRMDSNEAIFKQVLDDPEFRNTIAEFYLRLVYERLRQSNP